MAKTEKPKISAMNKGEIQVMELLAEEYGLPKPLPEYQFHPTRKYRFDLYFEQDGAKVALEIEGGVFRKGKGAHSSVSGILRDMDKYNEAAKLGIFVYRVLPKNKFLEKTFTDIKKILSLGKLEKSP